MVRKAPTTLANAESMPRPHSFLTRFLPAPSKPMRLKLETPGDVEVPNHAGVGAIVSCRSSAPSSRLCLPASSVLRIIRRGCGPRSSLFETMGQNLDCRREKEIVVRGRPSQGQDLSLPFALHHIKRLARVSESFPCRASVVGRKDSGRFLVHQRGISADRRSHGVWCVVCVVHACLSDLFRRLTAADVLGTLSLSHTSPAQRWDGHILGRLLMLHAGDVVRSGAGGWTVTHRRLSRHPSLSTEHLRELTNSGSSTGLRVPRTGGILLYSPAVPVPSKLGTREVPEVVCPPWRAKSQQFLPDQNATFMLCINKCP